MHGSRAQTIQAGIRDEEQTMKPSLIYAILIAVVVLAVSLYLRSNTHAPENRGTPVESQENE
jgi:hypothetical protein